MFYEVQEVTGRLIRVLGGMFRVRQMGNLKLSDTIIPVINSDVLMAESKIVTGNQDISAGGAQVDLLTAGENEEIYIDYVFQAAKTASSKLLFKRDGAYSSITHPATTAIAEVLPIKLSAGDSLAVSTTGNGADNAIEHVVLYTTFKIR